MLIVCGCFCFLLCFCYCFAFSFAFVLLLFLAYFSQKIFDGWSCMAAIAQHKLVDASRLEAPPTFPLPERLNCLCGADQNIRIP